MKLPSFLAVSLMCNLALAAIFFVLRQGPPAKLEAPPSAIFAPATLNMAPSLPVANATPAPVVPWRLIASADYRQYIANLRAVDCPDWLVRDIVVADIDDLYQQKARTDPVYFAPWQGVDERRKASRSRSKTLNALRQEKRALVKSLLGYEWDNHANEIWHQDFLTTLTFGFLSDDQAVQVLSLQEQYAEAGQNIREDANFILIDEDRARLQALYEELVAETSRLLDPSVFDELQLRAQQGFLVANDIHFDGVTISREELRELVRMSKSFKDMARSEFVPVHPWSEAEQVRWRAAFDSQVKTLLGPRRFADYQRAQDFDFREIFAFSRQNNVPPTAAIRVYEARQNAEEQAEEIQKDGNLSPEERTAALVVLKATTLNAISSALGRSYGGYQARLGQWFGTLAQTSEPQTGKELQ